MKLSWLLMVLVPVVALAQNAGNNAFPSTSTSATAQELSAYLSGRTLHAKYADGTKVKSTFSADGSLAATAPGFYDTGHWRVEEGKLCGSLRKMGEFCNEARFDAGALYLKRMNGEVVHYEPE